MKLLPLAFALAVCAALVACDGLGSPPPGPPPPLQTRILEIRLEPDTVAAADTVLMHAVIEDSLDTSFRYEWDGVGTSHNDWRYLPVDGRRDGPRVRFIAPEFSNSPGEVVNVVNGVRVDNDEPGTRPQYKTFYVPVQN